MRYVSFFLLLVSFVGVGVAVGYDVNKDLTNLGPDAKDLTVSLSGVETVSSHFDGYSSGPKQGRFGSFSTGPAGVNTEIRWQNFNDGVDDTIDTGQTIHVGWSTSDHSSSVRDMWWTDGAGNRIPGSIVFNITSDWRYETSKSFAAVSWANDFTPDIGPPEDVTISDTHFAVLEAAIELAELNTENAALTAALQPLPGGEVFVLAPGDSVEVGLPDAIAEGSAVVLRYSVDAPSSGAQALDFVQFVAEETFDLSLTGSCPGVVTLTQSGGTPNGEAAIAFSTEAGPQVVPGGGCAGTQIGLADPNLLTIAPLDGNGGFSIERTAPVGACDLFVQTVDLTSCEVSNVTQVGN